MSKKSGLRDLKLIKENPLKYAENISIKRLVTILQKLSDYYYDDKLEQILDDKTYDIMYDVLKRKDPKNKFLFETGTSNISKEDVKLPFTMPSLNKIKPGEKSLEKWINKYNGPYIVSDKLDGISAQIYKDNDGKIDIFTKKKLDIGTSKKHLLKYLVEEKVLDNIPNDTSVRG